MGKGGAAISLSNPVFLAIADDAAIRSTASKGVPGTPMPAFAQSAGGMLTDQQIDAIVRGNPLLGEARHLVAETFAALFARPPAMRTTAYSVTRRTAQAATALMAEEAIKPVPL